MTMYVALDRTVGSARPPRRSNSGASFFAAAHQIAARTLKQFVRTPALLIAGTAQGVLFLLIFRYVFGGAVAHTGALSYVDFLVPGFVVTGVLFQGMGAASGVADDLAGGLFDRLRSLPIRMLSIVSGRIGADTPLVAWGCLIMTAVGLRRGLSHPREPGRRTRRVRSDHPLRLRLRVALRHHGPHGRQPSGGTGSVLPRVPVELRVLGLRAGVDDARMDAGIRQQPTDDRRWSTPCAC